jgi:hypothetical protein
VVFVAVFISSAFGIQWGAEAKAVGDRIVRAQNLVAQTARTIVERDHRVRTKRVLFYPPIVHFAWNGCEPITTMFLKLPSTTRSVQQVLAEAKAGYALTLTYSLITDDVLEEHRVTELLQKTATPIATWVGEHTDYSTVYGQAISWGVDTLTLYRLDSIQ